MNIVRYIVFVGLLGGVPVISSDAQDADRSSEFGKPHIVVILVDDMGYGDPGSYNSESKISTPNIDLVAKHGMRFTDAHAPGPLCHMSRYGLMTGRYPFRTDVGRWPKKPLIDEDQMTLASMLQENGYRTAMVGKWHLGFEENGYDQPLPGGPVDRGFDSFFGIRASTDIPPYFYIEGRNAVAPPTDSIEANRSEGWTRIQGEFWRAGGIAPDLELKDVLPRFTEEAISVIDRHAKSDVDQPLFLYLAYPAPHTPWLPEESYRGKSGAGMYGDFAMMVDTMIGRVLQKLQDEGMEEETLLVFTSDNGPVWYPQDVERFKHDSSGGLRGMKADAWEAGHRMPFIVRWPGRIPAGSSSDQLLCFTDLMATFASMLNYELPEDAAPDSFSAWPTMLGRDSDAGRPSLAMQSGGGHFVMRNGPWKLITELGSGGFSEPRKVKAEEGQPPGQLYHLGLDKQEQKNLYDGKSNVVNRLTRQLEAIKSNPSHRQLAD